MPLCGVLPQNLTKMHSLQEIGWFDDNNNAVGVLTTRLATDASLVKGVSTMH